MQVLLGNWVLPETQQALRSNDLRGKIRLQTDGGLKTGLDVIKAALLGAESYGFGTTPMVAMGCKFLRICHLNNCATGVATQDRHLRDKHFVGTVDMVINFFTFLAEEIREWLAQMGYHSLEEIIGRTELLAAAEGRTSKQSHLNLSPILSNSAIPADKAQTCQQDRNPPFDRGELAERMVSDILPVIETLSGGEYSYEHL